MAGAVDKEGVRVHVGRCGCRKRYVEGGGAAFMIVRAFGAESGDGGRTLGMRA